MKKRAIFFIESLSIGGAEKVLANIVNNINRDRFDITVCSFFKYSIYDMSMPYPFKDHIQYRYIINNRYPLLYRLFNFFCHRVPGLLYKWLIGDKFDVVIAFYEGAPTYWVSHAKLKRGKRIAWLHTTTDLSQRGKNGDALAIEHQVYTMFDKIVAVSEGVERSFVNMFPDLAPLLSVAHNPVDLELIATQSEEKISIVKPECPLLVSVGRMTPAKGYGRYLAVLNRLSQEGFSFMAWIIGGGDRSEYENYVKENHLDKVVLFIGSVDNPYPYMKIADWVVLPSLIEGASMVLAEAISLRRATVSTMTAGSKMVTGGGELGFLVDNSENGIYFGLKEVLCNKDLQSYYQVQCENASRHSLLDCPIQRIESIILS